MPHMNVLDLSVFPAMSKRHSTLSRERTVLRVLKEDEIWDAAEILWQDLLSSKITSAYIQANGIAGARITIKSKGNNDFLGVNGSLHFGVRQDLMKPLTDWLGRIANCF
jgi:hypothetical protein